MIAAEDLLIVEEVPSLSVSRAPSVFIPTCWEVIIQGILFGLRWLREWFYWWEVRPWTLQN